MTFKKVEALARSRNIDDVRPLTVAERDALLHRLAVDLAEPRLDLLGRLQWSFLKASPFHNLDLLAGTAPRSPEECIQAVLLGRGGTCHTQATAFLALLRSLGFRAHLAAATINAPSDHLVVVVHLQGKGWVCDVGNGHPYRSPFSLQEPQEHRHVGWHFRTDPAGGVLRLRRRFDDGQWRQIYQVDPAPRGYAHFRHNIEAHHDVPGFGPFLVGLRAVLIRDDLVVTLRDLRYQRYSIHGRSERRVESLTAAGRVLRQTFDLGHLPIGDALGYLRERAPSWPVTTCPDPHLVITVATTDRPASLERLLRSIASEWGQHGSASGLSSPRICVLENSRRRADRSDNADAIERLNGTCELNFDYLDKAPYGRSIADSRREQTSWVARLRDQGVPVDAVWMLDDDLALEQLVLTGGSLNTRTDIRYFRSIAEAYRSRPEASGLIGGVCGDPPVRPEAVLQTQLFDLVANLERLMSMDPDAPYEVPDLSDSFDLPDYYYDHSRAGHQHLTTPFYWIPRTPAATVRTVSLELLDEAGGLFVGQTATRPLLHRPEEPPEELDECVLRGGNMLFLDIDAVLRHPYPTVRWNGVSSRRSDMVGAALLSKDGGTFIARHVLPLHHARGGETVTPVSAPPPGAVHRSLLAEFCGVLVARQVLDGLPDDNEEALLEVARRRANRIVDSLRSAARLADDLLGALERCRDSWLADSRAGQEAISALQHSVIAGANAYFGGMDRAARDRWFEGLHADFADRALSEFVFESAPRNLCRDVDSGAASTARLREGVSNAV